MRPSYLQAVFVAAIAALSSHPGQAATEVPQGGSSWCGVRPSRLTETIAEHLDSHARRQRLVRASGRTLPDVNAYRVGDVAVLQDEGQLVLQPNPYDLETNGLSFVPKVVKKKSQLQIARTVDAIVQPTSGSALALGDDASVEVAFPRGFVFPYFGKKYKSVWVNSDGNLTFGAADFQSSERSVARFLNGPPRIAPFFADLNPETATDGGGVFVSVTKVRAQFTWVRVPEFGQTLENTVQVTLFKDGKVTVAFGEIQSREGIVGLAPGDGGLLRLADLNEELPLTLRPPTALAERFGTDRQLDDLAIANAFFQEFADDYDHLVVWLDFPLSLGGAFAYEFGIKNEITGIGQPVFDQSRFAGSNGRLRSYVQMGNLGRYPANPAQTILGSNSTLDILGQETGHRWLAFLSFQRGSAKSTELLGRDLSHWSFLADSDASDMEGNDIRDNGNGSFITVDATSRFSLLDQYVMGLVGPEEVPPTLLVTNAVGAEPGDGPEVGRVLFGDRLDVPMSAILAAEGVRTPASSDAPKSFNMAFIVVTQSATTPTASIEKIDAFRRAWETYFANATDQRGTVDTTLR